MKNVNTARSCAGNVVINGMPTEISESEGAVFRSRILTAYSELRERTGNASLLISIGRDSDMKKLYSTAGQDDAEKDSGTSARYVPVVPSYSFEQLILPQKIMDDIRTAIHLLKVESRIFDEWGLRTIEPNPKVALNFYGKPGTGKTLAAHAVASYLDRKILIASYAEIESKYHGDGPKNVKAIFQAAEQEKALLFIDEADSLLSRRLTNVTQGSEQAINSMRSQLLINLEQFKGVVVFSTNLVHNYDKAFETRVRHIEFPMPDEHGRCQIWKRHLPSKLPLSADVSCERLAKEIDDVCGRDIKNAVIQSAIKAALADTVVSHSHLCEAVLSIKESRIKEAKMPEMKPLDENEKKNLEKKIRSGFGVSGNAEITIDVPAQKE